MTDRSTVRLARAVRDRLVSEARSGSPAEVCGVLGGERGDRDGNGNGPTARVTAVERVTNAARAPRTRYELDPGEQLAAMDALEAAGLGVVGFYHSHPRGPLAPSATDRAAANWPGHLYLIVSPADEPAVGAWRWTGESFEPVRVRIENDPTDGD